MKSMYMVVGPLTRGEPDERLNTLEQELVDKLLALGGTTILLHPGEPHLEALLQEGSPRKGRVRLVKGEPHRAHSNAAAIWAASLTPDGASPLRIVTGYGLNGDNWFSHSWVIDIRDQRIIETTVRRHLYYGVVLDEHECLAVWMSNCDLPALEDLDPGIIALARQVAEKHSQAA